MADCGATGAAETGVNRAAIPITVAAKVIFVSMDFILLALGRPAFSIHAHLCMSTLNLAATDGSSGIHPATTCRQSGNAYALLTGISADPTKCISAGPTKWHQGCGVFLLDTPREQQHLNKP